MKIREVTLFSTDVEKQEKFYKEVLGFACERLAEDHLIVAGGCTKIHFRSSKVSYYYHYCFLIPTGCMESAVEFLDLKGCDSLPYQGQRVFDFGNGRSVYFLDADGNIAEFIERPSIGSEKEGGFSIQDVLCVNEIGIPSSDPPSQAAQMIEKFEIDVVEGGVWRDDFVWCGDYQGTFVVSKVGRVWIPLERAAEPVRLEVKFETKTGLHVLKVEPT